MSGWIGKASVALVASIFGGIAYVWLLFAFGSGIATHNGQQRLVLCAEPTFDVGETTHRTLQHTFTLKNGSAETINITSIGRSCSCLVHNLGQAKLAPGGSTTLSVTIEVTPRLDGALTRFSEYVLLHVDQESAPIQELSIRGLYIPAIYSPVTRLRIAAPRDSNEKLTHDVQIYVDRAAGIEVDAIECIGVGLDASIIADRAVPGERHAQLTVRLEGRCDASAPLPQVGRPCVRAKQPEIEPFELPVSLYQPDEERIVAFPSRVTFGVVETRTPVARQITLMSSRESAFEVTSVEMDALDAISLHVHEPKADGHRVEQSIDCMLDPAFLSPGPLVDVVRIRLTSSEYGHERNIAIPLSGFLKPTTSERRESAR